ncbi:MULTISPECIES: hypothetical protein [Streptomyces]|uniref:ABC transporter permease n=1 Tax=Streptomyces griseocarneus TaxID=51201 RepID=A0ABX7RT72_9ACTN|nr:MULTISPECIES: hypothetical protein [Streptomyces]QSY51485.1 hypothetical protein J3S04_11780 [Streptomyces griseocarneus]
MTSETYPVHRPAVVFRSIGRCLLAYILAFAAGWLVIALVGPRELDPRSDSFETLPFWESFEESLRTGLTMFLLIGVPTILIALLAGLAWRTTESGQFRAIMALAFLPPMWPLVGASTPLYLGVQTVVQVVFATVLMPVPLIQGAPPKMTENARDSLLPVFAVDDQLSVSARSSPISVARSGDAYPDMEVMQYARNGSPKVVARDSMRNEHALDSAPVKFDHWPLYTANIDRKWTDGRCTSGCGR